MVAPNLSTESGDTVEEPALNARQRTEAPPGSRRRIIILGMMSVIAICVLASLGWDFVDLFRVHLRVDGMVHRAYRECGEFPTVADGDDWLRENGFENIDWKFDRPTFRGENGSFVLVCGEKVVSEGTWTQQGQYVVLSFGWDYRANRMFAGIDSTIEPLSKRPPPPPRMPLADP
jgi:hypothetical protein